MIKIELQSCCYKSSVGYTKKDNVTILQLQLIPIADVISIIQDTLKQQNYTGAEAPTFHLKVGTY